MKTPSLQTSRRSREMFSLYSGVWVAKVNKKLLANCLRSDRTASYLLESPSRWGSAATQSECRPPGLPSAPPTASATGCLLPSSVSLCPCLSPSVPLYVPLYLPLSVPVCLPLCPPLSLSVPLCPTTTAAFETKSESVVLPSLGDPLPLTITHAP